MSKMQQEAPFPADLAELVSLVRYREGWIFRLFTNYDRGQGSKGLTLSIIAEVEDSVGAYGKKGDLIRINHLFIVPAASYNYNSWLRWLLDRVLDVESHEACEFFEINGERPFAPHHGDGEDPYIIWMHGSENQRQAKPGK
jgi:hypothetical protein